MTPDISIISDAEYADIEAAVMETVRGRYFLAEYARRNRHADTTILVAELERLGAAIREQNQSDPDGRIRTGIIEMAAAINRTKQEIAAIKPEPGYEGKVRTATAELGSIVQATEAATSEILAAAEQVQEIAWTLREQGIDNQACDELDGRATDIYTACSFQDLTGQRIRKIIDALDYLEARIHSLLSACVNDVAVPIAGNESLSEAPPLMDLPALQDDPFFLDGEIEGWPVEPLFPERAFAETERLSVGAPVRSEPSLPIGITAWPMNHEEAALPTEPDDARLDVAVPSPSIQPPKSTRSHPFAPVDALSDEEKIALFS
jgi:chemotaxis regulatin CheY-phosphate phosphatase CheZ